MWPFDRKRKRMVFENTAFLTASVQLKTKEYDYLIKVYGSKEVVLEILNKYSRLLEDLRKIGESLEDTLYWMYSLQVANVRVRAEMPDSIKRDEAEQIRIQNNLKAVNNMSDENVKKVLVKNGGFEKRIDEFKRHAKLVLELGKDLYENAGKLKNGLGLKIIQDVEHRFKYTVPDIEKRIEEVKELASHK